MRFKYLTKDASGTWINWELPPQKITPLDRTQPEYWDSKEGDFEIVPDPFELPKKSLIYIEDLK